MRRNRRGPGYSGSVSFLARAAKRREADLVAALATLGLNEPATPNEKPVFVEIGSGVYWLNKDSRGGIWINGRERRESDSAPSDAATSAPAEATASSTEAAAASEAVSAPISVPESTPTVVDMPKDPAPVAEDALSTSDTTPPLLPPVADAADLAAHPTLVSLRPLLTPNKRGSGVSGEVGFLARTLGREVEELTRSLVGEGLSIPADADEKPVFVEHAGEIFWFNRNRTEGSLWLNAKTAKVTRKSSPRPRAPRRAKAAE
jgi:hypothetical protein